MPLERTLHINFYTVLEHASRIHGTETIFLFYISLVVNSTVHVSSSFLQTMSEMQGSLDPEDKRLRSFVVCHRKPTAALFVLRKGNGSFKVHLFLIFSVKNCPVSSYQQPEFLRTCHLRSPRKDSGQNCVQSRDVLSI